jgi:hypothetical protein
MELERDGVSCDFRKLKVFDLRLPIVLMLLCLNSILTRHRDFKASKVDA